MADRLSERTKITVDGASGTTVALAGTVLDMAGFDGVLFIAFATATSTAQHLKMQVGTASGSLSDTTGRVEHTVNTLYLDARPNERYVRGSFTASGASSLYRSLVSIQYGPRSVPTTNATASVAGLVVTHPGTGTATG